MERNDLILSDLDMILKCESNEKQDYFNKIKGYISLFV